MPWIALALALPAMLAAIEAAKPYPVLPEGADCLRGTVLRAVFRNPKR